MKNKRGLMTSIWFAIFIFIFGMLFLNYVYPEVTTARDGLKCSQAENITDGIKLECLAVDIVVPYWIMLVIAVVGGVVLDRVLT